jgi:preprotein translocase subunit SecB
MKISKSKLEFVDFLVLHTEYGFLEPSKRVNIKTTFNSYEVELDFGKKKEKLKNGKSQINIHIRIMINMDENPQPGYKILATGVGLFELAADEKMDKKEMANLENISALSISINAMRNYISQLTAHGPFGKFVLPAVNVNDLIREKVKASINQSKNEGK